MSPRRHMPLFAAAARRGYHHGALKDALVEAARALIAERGSAGFTLAEAAKRAGVTAAAPYRHFNDRNALLGELARRGFEAFGGRLREAWGDGRPDPVAALWRMGEAYLDFARKEPGLYAAMFADVRVLSEAPAIEASAAAFDSLRNAARAVLAHSGVAESGGRQLGAQIWAAAHGVASLANSGYFVDGAAGGDPRTILGASVGALIAQAVQDQARAKVR
ncbi:MAG: TetR/AcrR family transcriptional regulator [Roseiarcus sp.]